jgi:hypothetical protein
MAQLHSKRKRSAGRLQVRVRNLKQLAKLINDLDGNYRAIVEPSWSSTDSKVAVHRRSKNRIRAYTVQFENTNNTMKFPSRMVRKL